LTQHRYYSNADVSWSFSTSSGCVLRLVWDSFSTEDGYDVVRIYDTSSSQDLFLGAFTGYGQDRAVRTNGHSMRIEFTSDSSVTAAGFSAHIYAIAADSTSSFTSSSVTVSSTTNQFSSSSWWSWSTTGSTWSFISSSSSSSGITSQDSEADYCFSVYFGTCEDLPSFTSCASVDTTCHNTASLTTVSSSPSITFSNDALVANGIISFKQGIACSGEGLGYNGYSTPDCGSHASFYTMEEFYNMAGVTSSNSNLDEFASGQCTSVSTSMAIDMFFPFCGQTFSSQSYWPSFYNAGCLASPSVVALVAVVVVLSL